MKKYVDFDGVILDTLGNLFDDEYKALNIKSEEEKIKYMQAKDWEKLLNESKVINNSIELLKLLKDFIILTKVHSMENEGVAKIKFLRKNGVKNDIILAPFTVKKTDLVDPKDNILIDDTLHVLDNWKEKGGIPIFFNKDNLDMDGWKYTNTKYVKIKSLDCFKK